MCRNMTDSYMYLRVENKHVAINISFLLFTVHLERQQLKKKPHFVLQSAALIMLCDLPFPLFASSGSRHCDV